MNAATLFEIPSDAVEVTSDDCYTPRWVFDAMGLRFALDVAAPVGGSPSVPADQYFTAADDGLTQPWNGLVWCNPPYSNYQPWSERWANHDRGVLLGYQLPQVRWTRGVFASAEAVTFTGMEFARPGNRTYRLRQPVFVAFRGVGVEPAERLAAADPYGAVLYGRPK
jgi:DNA N-6-adenine-methyltransferase (Dam)